MTTASVIAPAERAALTAGAGRHGKLYWALADAWVLCWRNIVQLPRMPELLVFSIIQPVMFVLLFRFVFGNAIQVPGGDYVNFLMAGIFVQTVAFGSVGTGIGLAEDLHKGIIDRFRSLPMARSAVLVGRTMSDIIRNGISVAAMLIVGLLVGFRPDNTWWAYLAAAGLLMLFSFAFSWISAVIGLSVKTVEAAQSGGFIWLFPLTFCSTAFVPLDQLPSWMQGFAEYQPVSVTVTAVRGLTMDYPVGNSAWLSLAWSIGILAVFVPFAVRKYRRAAAR
jgi:ABC-2 type transport system permease protein/oleandomycin transport system permease protein